MSIKPCLSDPTEIAWIIAEYVNENPNRSTQGVNLHEEQLIYLASLFRKPAQKEIPSLAPLFYDPVTQEPLTRCVMTPCGHTFNRTTIDNLFARNLRFCPMDRSPVTENDIRDNRILTAMLATHALPKTVEVFVEIVDPTVSSLSSPDLAEFNRRLFSKIHSLDQVEQAKMAIADDALKGKYSLSTRYIAYPCGNTESLEDPVSLQASGCYCGNRSHIFATAIPNRLFQDIQSWARAYNETLWEERPCKTLPGKAGVFLNFCASDRVREAIVPPFASLGAFHRKIQFYGARKPKELLAAIDKFQDLAEMRRIVSPDRHLSDGDALLPTLFLNDPPHPIDEATDFSSIPLSETPYIHLQLICRPYGRSITFCNPDLIPAPAQPSRH